MGEAKKKLSTTQAFVKSHPRCCYCFGNRTSTTREHYPPITMFVRRDRPNDFVFPACSECNSASRKTDLILSFLAISTAPSRQDSETQMQKLANGIKKNCPKSFSELIKSKSGNLQREKSLREKGYDLKVLSLSTHLLSHIECFAKKLVCSVYYRDSGKILNDCY